MAKILRSPDNLPAAIEKLLKEVIPSPLAPNNLTDDQKIKIIEENFHEIMVTLGLDMKDDSLRDTPKRIAKMFVREVFKGLDPKHFPKITTIENKMDYDQMVLVQDIELLSTCEHHFQPIQGFATVAYIPSKKVIGLSKINRIVEYFARRPQVQERLTKQIADCLQGVLQTEDVAVHINAKHFCVIARGIEDAHSSTVTSDLRGEFKRNGETRHEFLVHCTAHANTK
ncbi:MAG: GTP cyclohydrolase I FolE [Bdellovibrionales bacterium]